MNIPLFAGARLRHHRGGVFDATAELRIPAAISGTPVLALEGLLITAGASLPFGRSLMLAARRPGP